MQLWRKPAIELLRVLINDLNDTPTYTEDRLARVLIVSGFQVSLEASFAANFTVNIVEQTINPDPVDVLNSDIFINLMCIKAACIIDTGTAMLAAQAASAGADMVHKWDLRGVAESTLALLDKGWCATYEAALDDYEQGGAICGAVISPFRMRVRELGYPCSGRLTY